MSCIGVNCKTFNIILDEKGASETNQLSQPNSTSTQVGSDKEISWTTHHPVKLLGHFQAKLVFGRQPHFDPTIRNMMKNIWIPPPLPWDDATLTQQQKCLLHNKTSSTAKNTDTIPKNKPNQPLLAVT